MFEKILEEKTDKRILSIYKGDGVNLPVVYSTDSHDGIEDMLKCCEEIGCRPFHYVSVSEVEWNECLSPWPAPNVISRYDNFSGGAAAYLKWFVGKIIPEAENILFQKDVSRERKKPGENAPGEDDAAGKRYISGYSMAGLFALWALYNTDIFNGAVSASGSVWFPDFEEYCRGHELKNRPEGIYLSIGGRESKVRNQYMKETESIDRRLRDYYNSLGIRTVFEINPGNHFKDPDLRVAKGLKWLLKN